MSKQPGTLTLRVTVNNAKELYRILREAAGLLSVDSLSDKALLEALRVHGHNSAATVCGSVSLNRCLGS
jgi:hypothetical protein